MGMYTRFMFWATVDKAAYDEIKEAANSTKDEHPAALMRYSSAYWDTFDSKCKRDAYVDKNSTYPFVYLLKLDCSLKNYNDEIGKFLEWVTPHVRETWEFSGLKQYEEEETPTLLFQKGKQFVWQTVENPLEG